MRLFLALAGLLGLVSHAAGQAACVVERFGIDHCAWNGHGSCTQRELPYLGSRAVGKTTILAGTTCQRWDSQSPHSHSNGGGGVWGLADPDAVVGPTVQADEAGNTCANPDGEPGPWCYTVDSGNRWTFCFGDCSDTCTAMPISNGNLPAASHARGQATGATSTVACDTGFGPDPASAHTYRCNAGQWLQDGTSDPAVTARCIQCPAIASAGASAAPNSFAYGTAPAAVPGATGTVTCDAGYERSDYAGNTYPASCGADGVWDPAFAADVCVESPCDEQAAPGTVGQTTIAYSAAPVASGPNRYPGGSTVDVSCTPDAHKWESAVPSATCSLGAWDATVSTACQLCPWVKASSESVFIKKSISDMAAQLVGSATTLAECEQACVDSAVPCAAFTFDEFGPSNRRGNKRCYLHGPITKSLVKQVGGTGYAYVQKCAMETLTPVTGCGVDTKVFADGNASKRKPSAHYSYMATGGKTLGECALDCDLDLGAAAGKTCDFIAFNPNENGGGYGDCALLTGEDYAASGGAAMEGAALPTDQYNFHAKTCAPMAM